MIFDELKKRFQSSIKDQIIDIDEIHQIKNILLITDNYDDVEERVTSLEKISSRFGSNLLKIYLYDMTNLLSHENLEKSWIIDVLKAHSSNIRALKDKDFKIILEATVKTFLIELRTARSSSSIDLETIKSDEIEALADFLVSAPTRQRNFISSILNSIQVHNPDLIYWKPPFLTKRALREGDNPIRNFSLNLLRELPSNLWIFLEGNKNLDSIQLVMGLLFGGQGEIELHELVYSVNSLFYKHQKPKLTLLVHIDEYEFSLAKMIAQKTIAKISSDKETKFAEEDIPDIDDELTQTLVSEKYNSMIENLRVAHDALEFTVSFGDLNTLQAAFRSMNPDCLILPLKKGIDVQFIDRIIIKANLALNQGISVLIV